MIDNLKSLRRTEVTNRHDIINDTPTTPIIFIREAITILLMHLGYKVNQKSLDPLQRPK